MGFVLPLYSGLWITIFITVFQTSLQDCPEEISRRGIVVTWPATPSGHETLSTPICYSKHEMLTRYCNGSQWFPPLTNLRTCTKVKDYIDYDYDSCPPGFHQISESSEYCYHIDEPSAWDYPCFKTGGTSIISEFIKQEINDLLETLASRNISRFFWLPGLRRKLFNPVVWYTPGPNWGREIDNFNHSLSLQTPMLKNCLLLDIEKRLVTTETCSAEYPSLCFYLNKIGYRAKCPEGYYAYRFLQDHDTCFGIESSDVGLTFDNFLETKCEKAMGDNNYTDLTRFIFKNIAELGNLPADSRCWFQTLDETSDGNNFIQTNHSSKHFTKESFEQVINGNGSLLLMKSSSKLQCMACEVEIEVCDDVTLQLDYDTIQTELYLTIYNPTGLWKYDETDNGIQCFSDANGFVTVIEVNQTPVIKIENSFETQQGNNSYIEKIVYTIDLITDRPAQYWCEGHIRNFSLISTSKVIANPRGSKIHVFALVLNTTFDSYLELNNITNIVLDNMRLYGVETVLLMDILEYSSSYALLLMHLHMKVSEIYDNKADNLLHMYATLKATAESQFQNEIKFLNLSSSLYCLPTFSIDLGDIRLHWELTLLVHIVAPQEFCLQSNGLPVKRQCKGSYLLGGIWGEVDGQCDQSYQPTETTSFLYSFVKGQKSENTTSRFLTEGLDFVLSNTSIIIPADIYYLSMSLQHVISVANENKSSIDLGDIDNIAWAMDRVTSLDYEYLRLSQTLNSTNVILDSIIDIIEMISMSTAGINNTIEVNDNTSSLEKKAYQISIQPQFIVQISYPLLNNITGIAIIRQPEKHPAYFTNVEIRPLYKNSTISDILKIDNLEVATWVPDNVIKTLKLNKNESEFNITDTEDLNIVISVFYNDVVFQQLNRSKHYVNNNRIIGVTIPGFISNLEHSIPIIFNDIANNTFNKYCGYWDFHQFRSGNNPGFWSNNGCFNVKSIANITVCECYHMTHFGQLIDIGGILYPANKATESHARALNIITLVGSFLSISGVIGIWITALVFQVWRKKASTKVLLQLSTSVALPLVFILIFNLENSLFIVDDNNHNIVANGMEYLCIMLGAMLHYSIISSFMWMLITAVLQFIRYVRVLGCGRPSRFMIKFAIFGWGVPLLPVLITLVIDMDCYLPHSERICYPTGRLFVFCVVVPIILILIVNIILFILVILSISRGPDGKIRITNMDLVGAQFRLSLFLFFLLGLTWIFGIFSFSRNILWSYLFCLTSTLQGFIIFIYFVILDPATRGLWVTLMTPQLSRSCSVSRRSTSITSISSS